MYKFRIFTQAECKFSKRKIELCFMTKWTKFLVSYASNLFSQISHTSAKIYGNITITVVKDLGAIYFWWVGIFLIRVCAESCNCMIKSIDHGKDFYLIDIWENKNVDDVRSVVTSSSIERTCLHTREHRECLLKSVCKLPITSGMRCH